MDTLDYEEESGSEEVKTKVLPKKKARRGSGKVKKAAKQEQKEEDEKQKKEEDKDPLITITSAEYKELKNQGQLVLQMAARLEVVERAMKRANDEGVRQLPTKRAKEGPLSTREKLCARPHLIDPTKFHNWWSSKCTKSIV